MPEFPLLYGHPKSTADLADDLFNMEGVRVRELLDFDIPLLQKFFVANPEYFFAVNGMAPRDDEARYEFESRPPPEVAFEKVYMIGFFDASGSMIAMTSIDSNFLAKGIWHIALFIVATTLHGSGKAASIFAGIETWLCKKGARWIWLGAVCGNIRAERFWEKSGFVEVRRRSGIPFGVCTQTVRVLVKPVATSGLAEYLEIAHRDRAASD